MTRTARDLADALIAAYATGPAEASKVLTDHLADQVMIVHEPRLAGDGPRAGADMRRIRLAEIPAFEKALEDFREEADVTVDGDWMTVRMVVSGKRRSTGDRLRETVESRFRVEDGRIVEMLAVSQSDNFAVFHEVLRGRRLRALSTTSSGGGAWTLRPVPGRPSRLRSGLRSG